MQLTLTNNPPPVNLVACNTVINDIDLLDMLVEENECTNIIVESFLSNFNIENTRGVLEKILSKLRINGTIIITDIEIEVIANDLLLSNIDLEMFNSVIFAGNKARSLLTIETVRHYLEEFGIKITRSYIENNFFVLEGKRAANG